MTSTAEDEDQLYYTTTGREASASQPQNRSKLRTSPLILYPSYGNLTFRIFR
jgi:hypothetical protein